MSSCFACQVFKQVVHCQTLCQVLHEIFTWSMVPFIVIWAKCWRAQSAPRWDWEIYAWAVWVDDRFKFCAELLILVHCLTTGWMFEKSFKWNNWWYIPVILGVKICIIFVLFFKQANKQNIVGTSVLVSWMLFITLPYVSLTYSTAYNNIYHVFSIIKIMRDNSFSHTLTQLHWNSRQGGTNKAIHFKGAGPR